MEFQTDGLRAERILSQTQFGEYLLAIIGFLEGAADGCQGKKSAQLSQIAVSVTHAHGRISE
jgi:hypothetical protein